MLHSHSLAKNLFFTFFLIFLFVAIYLSASWGMTSVSVIQPHQLMLKWSGNKIPFSEKQWKVALNKLQIAIENNPNNAQYYFDLAQLYDWAAYQKQIWHNDAITNRTKAIFYYKKSLEIRPTWSAAWANLAMSQTLNLEFGDGVKTALSNAMTYGPWEGSVFRKVLWVSLANWKSLPGKLQQQVIARIKEMVNSKGRVPEYVEQTAKHFKWQDELKEVIKQVVNRKEHLSGIRLKINSYV